MLTSRLISSFISTSSSQLRVRSMSSKIYDTVIIGAGWAGAVAAHDLVNQGRSVLVLEARDRVGGRAKTFASSQGDAKIDVGCSWIHGYNEGNPTRYLAKELGVEAHLPKPATGAIYGPNGRLDDETAAALRGSLAAAQEAFKTPHPPPKPTDSLASALFSADSPLFGASGKLSTADPETDLNATNPADPSLPSQAKSSSSAPKRLEESFARMLEVPLGLKLEKASLRWAGWESTTSFAGSDAAPGGGYEALVVKVFDAAKSKGAEVECGTEVQAVRGSDGPVSVQTKDGHTYRGRTVLSTIPLAVLKTLSASFFEPALPPTLQETIKGTHVGVLEKLLLRYDTAWWPDAEATGSYTFLPTSATAPTESSSLEEIFAGSTLICANFACPNLPGPTPTLLTYLSETPASLLLSHPADQVAEAYHAFLVSRFRPSTPPPKPVECHLTDWLTDRFSRGATTTPSIVSQNGERSPMDFKELSRPVWSGKLGFAGEHTEMEHRGSVAGAVISGQREAARINRYLELHAGK